MSDLQLIYWGVLAVIIFVILLGRVNDDGTVRDSNNHLQGYAKGVPKKYAALYFFFSFF